jgi:flavin reductase (DIM6/NTAB) family NADH-FMN oxidoreductase RutF
LAYTEIEAGKAADYLPSGICIVSSAANGKQTALTVTKVGCMSTNPMLMTIGIVNSRYSYELIKASGEFVINVPTKDQIDLLTKVGRASGRDMDKFAEFNIPHHQGSQVSAPVIDGAAAVIECRVVDSVTVGDRTMFVGQAVAVGCDEAKLPVIRYRGKYSELREQV